jgi:CBS domain-containing protein
MTVKAILSLKGSEVTTIEPSASLAAAAKVLAERRIGALVVMDSAGGAARILSERDIVRALAERGAAALASCPSATSCVRSPSAAPLRSMGASIK